MDIFDTNSSAYHLLRMHLPLVDGDAQQETDDVMYVCYFRSYPRILWHHKTNQYAL